VEHESSLHCSQEPATGSYPDPDEFIPHSCISNPVSELFMSVYYPIPLFNFGHQFSDVGETRYEYHAIWHHAVLIILTLDRLPMLPRLFPVTASNCGWNRTYWSISVPIAALPKLLTSVEIEVALLPCVPSTLNTGHENFRVLQGEIMGILIFLELTVSLVCSALMEFEF
jgi:hypothetical protein